MNINVFKIIKSKIQYIFSLRTLYLTLLFIFVASIFIVLNREFYIEIILMTTICFIGSLFIFTFLNSNLNEKTDTYIPLNKTILIADKSLPFLRHGLNKETADQITEIIKTIYDVPAVAITDKEKVLSFRGTGCEKHPAGKKIVTQATIDVIETGKTRIINSKKEFNCHEKNCYCPLESAVISPLFCEKEVIGVLKLYFTQKGKVSDESIKLATGISKLLSMQMELLELDRQAQLVTEAKLDALQAQINPHFLFNALNTINMYINKNPEFARKLVIRFSSLLRYMLNSTERFITLEEEIKNVEAYVIIEKARFGDKLEVIIDIDEKIKDVMIPVLTIQPLVQNSVLHGIMQKSEKGSIKINAHRVIDQIVIAISDNGLGIKQSDIEKIFKPGFGTGCGVGIPNVNERLKILYGENYGLHIDSIYGQGTTAWFKIPIDVENEKR